MARRADGARRACPRGRSGSPGRCTGSSPSATATGCCGPRSSGTTSAPAAECAEIERRLGLDRLDRVDREPGADRLHRAEAALARTQRARDSTRGSGAILLPKDYVRLRLTGEHAIDVADASGTLLFDVGARRWSEEVCEALEIPTEWLPPAFESTEVAGAGDQAAGALGVGIVEPGPALGRARHLGRRLRRAAVVRAGPGGARPRLLPRRAGDVARDGRDALGRRLVRAGCARRARRSPYGDARRRGGALGAGRRGTAVRARTCRASGRRTPTPTCGAPSPACPSATTAARSRGRSSRASPTACATRSSSCARSARSRRSAGSRAAARGATSGCGSSPPCSASRSSGPSPTRAPPTALRCSPACARACSPTRPRPSRAASASASRIDPEPGWLAAYDEGYERFRGPLSEAPQLGSHRADPCRRAGGAARSAARARPPGGAERLRPLRTGLHPLLHGLRLPLERATRRSTPRAPAASRSCSCPSSRSSGLAPRRRSRGSSRIPEYPGTVHPMRIFAGVLGDLGIRDAIGADQDGYPGILGYQGPPLSEVTGARVAAARGADRADDGAEERGRARADPRERPLVRARPPAPAGVLAAGATESEASLRAGHEATLELFEAARRRDRADGLVRRRLGRLSRPDRPPQLVGPRRRAQHRASSRATCSSPRRARRSGATTPSSSGR